MRVRCLCCESYFEIAFSRLKHGRGKYCSTSCQYDHQKIGQMVLTPATIQTCPCGKQFRHYDSSKRGHKGAGTYCSRVCRDKYRVREAIPNWRGGSDKHYTRGSNWSAQRRAALRRDSKTCQHCGSADNPQVHHVLPFRLFDDYREANKLKNLLTLCPPCHRKADAEFQRNEL